MEITMSSLQIELVYLFLKFSSLMFPWYPSGLPLIVEDYCTWNYSIIA